MKTPLKPQQVDRRGIRGITPEMVMQAKADGKRWKLISSAERHADAVKARVAPELVDASSPLYGIMGSSTGLTFRTDVLPDYSVTVSERPGMMGGPDETAYGLFADFINAVK
jgi:homoserine dehydrogenase